MDRKSLQAPASICAQVSFHVNNLVRLAIRSTQQRNKVSIGQAALVRHGIDFGLAQDRSGPRRRTEVQTPRRAN
jgi:hypothetical protein